MKNIFVTLVVLLLTFSVVIFAVNYNRTLVIQQKLPKKKNTNKNTYKIIWKFKIKPEFKDEFETVYKSDGKWTQLFQQATGYIGTELLRYIGEDLTYITIDTWMSLQDFEEFKIKWGEEYKICDQQCEKFTVSEVQIGSFESI